jgi:hypothetical protein
MDRTAIDIVIELIRTGSIPNDDAKLLLEAINQKGGTQFVPLPYESPYTSTYPYRPGDVWYTTNTHTSGYSQAEGTTDNQPKTTLTTNG